MFWFAGTTKLLRELWQCSPTSTHTHHHHHHPPTPPRGPADPIPAASPKLSGCSNRCDGTDPSLARHRPSGEGQAGAKGSLFPN